jgi:single-strand DNA-binding protein
MPDFNEVTLMGRLLNDPRLVTTATGNRLVNFQMEVRRTYKDRQGRPRETKLVVWCAAWNEAADSINAHREAGDPIFVRGRLENDEWEDQSGTKQHRVGVVAEKIVLLPRQVGGSDASLHQHMLDQQTR